MADGQSRLTGPDAHRSGCAGISGLLCSGSGAVL